MPKVEQKIAEAIDNQPFLIVFIRLQNMRMVADNYIGTGIDEFSTEFELLRSWVVEIFQAPMD